MVSKIHVKNLKHSRITVKVSAESTEPGAFQLINVQEKYISGKERVIDLGHVPAQFILIEVVKGVPLRATKEDIQVFGMAYKEINQSLGVGFHEILFENTYKIVHGFK